jgi:hypothetical protein
MQQSPAEIVASLLPLVFLTSLPMVIGAFYLAPKMGRNPWLWAILMLVPIINIIPAYIFFFLAVGAVLDRLNAITDRLKNITPFT